MPRFFEFNEVNWAPAWYGPACRELLTLSYRFLGYHRLWRPAVRGFLRAHGADSVLDIGSGDMGAMPFVLGMLDEPPNETGMRLVLSDLHPIPEQVAAVNNLRRTCLAYHAQPLDACDVPPAFDGIPRTIVNAFHHFKPEQARQVVTGSLRGGSPVLILEYVRRTPLSLLSMLAGLAIPPLLFPFLKRKTWAVFFFTYALPLFSLMFFWDGVVSCLRAYSSREISSICHAACADTGGIEIFSGVRRSLTFPAGVTWHILVPAHRSEI